ncbi:unnamed protein product [Ectocarpus sp. CCAP 1310/34]|nr:unnamed protein product [Ectocarpus sp. CCAP 1310/34]
MILSSARCARTVRKCPSAITLPLCSMASSAASSRLSSVSFSSNFSFSLASS